MEATEQQKIDAIYWWYHRRKKNLGFYTQAGGGENTECIYNFSKGVFRDTTPHHRHVIHEIYWNYCLGYSGPPLVQGDSKRLFNSGLNKKITKSDVRTFVRQYPNGYAAPSYFWDMYKDTIALEPAKSDKTGNNRRGRSGTARTKDNGSTPRVSQESSDGGGLFGTLISTLVIAVLVTYLGLPILWEAVPAIGSMFGYQVPGGLVVVVWILLVVFEKKK